MKESFLKILGIPKIIESNFKLNKEYVYEKGKKLNLNIEMNTNITESQEKKNLFICKLELKILGNEEITPFTLEVVVEGLFEITEEEDKFKEVLKFNGPAILLSYVRPYISNITLVAGIDPVVLPLLNFAEK